MTMYPDSNAINENSLLIRYNSSTSEVIKIYDLGHNGHVGGVGYTYMVISLPPWWTQLVEVFFVSNGNSIDMFHELDADGVLRDDYNNDNLADNFLISHTSSFISVSNGYLWTGEFYDDYEYPLTGYKVSSSLGGISLSGSQPNSGSNLIPNFNLELPVKAVQGIYCDSDPDEDVRLNFYISKSFSDSYYTVYLATLSVDKINGWNYWESVYAPYTQTQTDTKLPQGLEGIVKKDGELWVANEGATDKYCDADDWTRVDCAREILRIDPIIKVNEDDEEEEEEIFPSGSLKLYESSGLDNFAYKAIIVFAQNKKGEFYYSTAKMLKTVDIEEYTNWPYDVLKVFFEDPTPPSYNSVLPYSPKGYQEASSINKVAVFEEDVRGVFFFNLKDPTSSSGSDDWILNKIRITFDDMDFTTNTVLYNEDISSNIEFGDNTGDNNAMLLGFDIRLGSNSVATLKPIRLTSQFGSLYSIYEGLQNCYDDVFIDNDGTEGDCIQTTLPSLFEANVVCGGTFDFQNYLNNMSTLHNIIFDCN